MAGSVREKKKQKGGRRAKEGKGEAKAWRAASEDFFLL